MCVLEKIYKSLARRYFVFTQVNSNQGDVFDNPSDNEYDLDLSDDKEDREFSSEQSMDPSYGVFKDEADVSSDRY